MRKILFAIAVMALAVPQLVAAGDLRKTAVEAGLKAIPRDRLEYIKLIGNPDEEQIRLGKMLYFDPRLSKSGLISCNSCHNLAIGGVDGVPAAIGHKWTANPHHLNSPTVYNAVFNKMQMWDGRFASLEEQAQGPIQAPPEMAAPSKLVVDRVATIPEYIDAFKKAFPREENPLTFENIARAIAAFERTLVTPSRFDDYLNGDDTALTNKEKRGLELFIKKGCVGCHNGVGIGGGSMQPFPMARPYRYAHVGDFKGNKDGMVKVPLLRNITETAPYFHNGAVWTLEEAVRIMGETQLGVTLKKEEVAEIVAFLGSLRGRKPTIIYPILPPSTPDTPKPDVD